VRRLLAGERVTFEGRYHRVEDAVLLPRPARRPTLMVGANGPRLLSIALPHADVWNTWYSPYGNSAEGFARLNSTLDSGVERSACVLVSVDGGAGERRFEPDAPPVESTRLAAHLQELAEAGADEAILVLDPITERSIRTVAALLERGGGKE
jgi:alkanesulfonate monooxygenase SsuD/methylene tetrahydromethanopterin reductase-like flavin-dependent oxidoreductase (luciferase family)